MSTFSMIVKAERIAREEFGSGTTPVALRAPSVMPLPNSKFLLIFLPEPAKLHNHRRTLIPAWGDSPRTWISKQKEGCKPDPSINPRCTARHIERREHSTKPDIPPELFWLRDAPPGIRYIELDP
jgi:hypothetical protein